jgi:branched-chain amino acid transport system substrate-binding protein
MKKSHRGKLLVSISVLLAALFFGGTAFTQDTIKVGIIIPLSGAAALNGEQDVKHFNLLYDEINAKGGVLGKKLEVKYYDNKNAPNDTVLQMNRAIADGVRILGQVHSSGCTAALNEAVRKHNARNPDQQVILFVWDTTDTIFNNEACNFWMFHFGQNAIQRGEALAQYVAKDKSIKSVYLINQDYAHGHASSKAYRAALERMRPDIKIVGDDFHPVLKVRDFSPYVNAIRASKADVIMTSSWGNDLILLVKEANKSGLKAKFITTYAGGIGTPTALGEAGEGTTQLTEWHINYKNGDNETSQFALRMKQKTGMDMTYQDINTLTAFMIKAMEQTKSIKPIDIAFAMEGMKMMTPTGEYTMRAEDHQALAPQIVSIFTKNVKPEFTVENTGMGWVTVMEIPPIVVPTTCKMERPPRPQR